MYKIITGKDLSEYIQKRKSVLCLSVRPLLFHK